MLLTMSSQVRIWPPSLRHQAGAVACIPHHRFLLDFRRAKRCRDAATPKRAQHCDTLRPQHAAWTTSEEFCNTPHQAMHVQLPGIVLSLGLWVLGCLVPRLTIRYLTCLSCLTIAGVKDLKDAPCAPVLAAHCPHGTQQQLEPQHQLFNPSGSLYRSSQLVVTTPPPHPSDFPW